MELGNKTISSVVLKPHCRVLMPETAVPFQYIHKTYAETGLVYDNSWFSPLILVEKPGFEESGCVSLMLIIAVEVEVFEDGNF